MKRYVVLGRCCWIQISPVTFLGLDPKVKIKVKLLSVQLFMVRIILVSMLIPFRNL